MTEAILAGRLAEVVAFFDSMLESWSNEYKVYHWSCLHSAALRGHREAFKLLLTLISEPTKLTNADATHYGKLPKTETKK